jgi:hypothetical protein
VVVAVKEQLEQVQAHQLLEQVELVQMHFQLGPLRLAQEILDIMQEEVVEQLRVELLQMEALAGVEQELYLAQQQRVLLVLQIQEAEAAQLSNLFIHQVQVEAEL